MLVSGSHHSLRFNIIGRRSNHHTRDTSHKSEVLAALMSRAVLANGNSAVSRADLHVQFRITHRVAHLLKSASCGKHREGAYKRNFSCSCKTCSDAYHVALCDTAVNVAFRKFFLKHSGLGSCSKVSIQNNDIFMFFSKFYQSCAVAGSCSDFLYF